MVEKKGTALFHVPIRFHYHKGEVLWGRNEEDNSAASTGTRIGRSTTKTQLSEVILPW